MKNSKGRILAVDDTPASLRLLTGMLEQEGYEVRSAINGSLALNSAAIEAPELVLLDIRMPGMDGFEVCRQFKSQPATQAIPIIFVSALSETNEKVEGFKLGAADFVTKPYQREELLIRVRTHLEMSRLRHHLETLVEQRTKTIRANLFDFITAIAATIEMRDPDTAGHQRRTANLATAIAKQMKLPERMIEGLYLAGAMHDIGKIRVPIEILSKPGQLTDLEFDLIKQHSQSGYDILKTIDFSWPLADIVLQHHERLDGTGYPHGLKDQEIMLEAKILAVADVVEAMISHRPYRPALGIKMAINEINTQIGTRYDPLIVATCLSLLDQHGEQILDLGFSIAAPDCH